MCHLMQRNIPIINFDQPLWWKAPQIRESQRQNIIHVYRDLRSFVLRLEKHVKNHLRTLFIWCFTQCHGRPYVVHVDLCEKNQLPLRSIQSCYMYLRMITVSEIIKLKWTHKTSLYETEAEPQKQHFLEQLVEFYYEVTSGTLSLTDVQSLPPVRELSEIVLDIIIICRHSKIPHCGSSTRTRWIYLVNSLIYFKAERLTGNWKMHLQTTHAIIGLPIFTERGHNLWTKSW